MIKRSVVPEALSPDFLSDCVIGSSDHARELLTKLIRFTNLHIQFNHHRVERFVRLMVPTCFDQSDDFIIDVEAAYCQAFESKGWRVEVHHDKRMFTGSWVFLMKRGSEGEQEFLRRVNHVSNEES